MSVYNYSVTAMNGKEVALSDFRGKVLLIVNTASQCGFTFQFQDLERMYKRYAERGFIILGFPCGQFAEQELDTNDKINAFCMLNYGVTFPMFQKLDVRDAGAHPLFNYLASQKPFEGFDLSHSVAKILMQVLNERHPEYLIGDSIKWNFTKFLINSEGQVVKRFEATTDPLDMEADIEMQLAITGA